MRRTERDASRGAPRSLFRAKNALSRDDKRFASGFGVTDVCGSSFHGLLPMIATGPIGFWLRDTRYVKIPTSRA